MSFFVVGLTAFFLGVFLLLVLLSPRGENRPLAFHCQRCHAGFRSPPLHPLPERYQEEDLCLCEGCCEMLEERVRDGIRQTQARFLAEPGSAGGARDRSPEVVRPPD